MVVHPFECLLLQENVTILNVQQASDPIVNVAEPLIENDQSGTEVNATGGAPPRPSSVIQPSSFDPAAQMHCILSDPMHCMIMNALEEGKRGCLTRTPVGMCPGQSLRCIMASLQATTPAGLGGNTTSTTTGRRLLVAASVLRADRGGARGCATQGLASLGLHWARGAGRRLLGRRGLLQAVRPGSKPCCTPALNPAACSTRLWLLHMLASVAGKHGRLVMLKTASRRCFHHLRSH